MRSFRKIVCSIVVLFLFVMIANHASRYMYEAVDETSVYTRKELEETKGTVDTLLLGTSLVHWGLDPSIFSEELDAVCFNLATELQPISGSYYLLKDQLQNNPIKHVFLGIGVSSMVSNTNGLAARRLLVLDRMLSASVQLEYILDQGEFRDFEQWLLYPTRVENIFTFDEIKFNITYKQTEDFQNNIPPESSYWEYAGMGFQTNDKVYNGRYNADEIGYSGIWDRENIREANVEYLTKMAELCHENGVDFNVVIFPHAYEFARLQGDLSDMDAYFEDLCEELDIGLFDYNYTAYEGIYDILPDEYYWDKKHLNAKGAATIAELICSDYKERAES